jgi:hypothetical protein
LQTQCSSFSWIVWQLAIWIIHSLTKKAAMLLTALAHWHYIAAPHLHQLAGKAELTRTQQKVDGLQKLARSLTTENKVCTCL